MSVSELLRTILMAPGGGATPKPAGWLTGWGYRKSHTINGSVAGAQASYQLEINVHRAEGSDSGNDVYVGTKCREDFGDIRFTEDDGESLLEYAPPTIDGGVATFWVDVEGIPEGPGTIDIYVYYGKGDATSIGDGDATFIFWDDFTEDRGWTIGNPAYIYLIMV